MDAVKKNEFEGLKLSPFATVTPITPQLLRRNWGWLASMGIIMVIMGALTSTMAVFSTFFTVWVVGWLMIVGGVIQVVNCFSSLRRSSHVLIHLLSGILYAVAGFLFLRNPFMGAVALTMLLASTFIVGGIFRGFLASTLRFPQWGWAVVSGAVSVVLGSMVLGMVTEASLWLIGLYVGIDLMFTGLYYTATGLAAKASIPLSPTPLARTE